jgi:hypothetical protein
MALSFAIQRPKPAAFANDSDEEDAPAVVEERISELGPKSKAQARQPSLVIPSQPNKDWKAEASRMRGLARKTQTYLPQNERARASTAQPDGQTDRIIDKTVGGLKVHEATSRSGTVTPTTELAREISATTLDSPAPSPAPAPLPLTEDELALRELLRGPDAEQEEEIETIHIAEDSFNLRAGGNVNEDDLFKQDLASRPDSATLADYARVPVEQFGAALLRGMSASSTSRPVKTEAYIPKARPSLLGIGAKPLEMPTDGKATKKELSAREKAIKRREEMHFVPLVKRKVVSAIEGPAVSSHVALLKPSLQANRPLLS